MRIAGSTISRNYLKHLERNMSSKYDSEMKISSYRQFQKASECPAQAATAMRVRKAINNIANYQDNLKTAKNIYSNAQSSVMNISELIQTSYEKLIEAANGTRDKDQMGMLAQTLESNADEIVRLMNLTVADRKIFGGVNNETNCYAIKTGGDGVTKTVTYNGVSVGLYEDPTLFPDSQTAFSDIGLGMTLLPDGSVDPQSALPMTMNGAKILGCGYSSSIASFELDKIQDGDNYRFSLTVGADEYYVEFTGKATEDENIDAINAAIQQAVGHNQIKITGNAGIVTSSVATAKPAQITLSNANTDFDGDGALDFSDLAVKNTPSGYSNNVVQVILDAAEAIREGNGDEIARFADQVYASQTNVSLAIADIGNVEKFIDFNITRLTNNLYSLQERQNDLEATDLTSESTNWKVLDAIYNATLQMSASVVPDSIFKFL